jgi:hypothetical protein
MSRNKIKSVQRIFIFIFVSLSFVWAENEVTLTSTIKNKCNDKILSWDISPATMQNLAYMWTHQQKMEQWHYEEDKSRPVPMTFLLFPDAECRLIEYETMVLVPTGFSRIIPARSRAHALCVSVTLSHTYTRIPAAKLAALGTQTQWQGLYEAVSLQALHFVSMLLRERERERKREKERERARARERER